MCLNCWVAQTVIPRVCDTLDALPEHQQHVRVVRHTVQPPPRALTSSCSLSFCHLLPQKLQVLTALDACQRGGKLFDTVQNTHSHSRAHCPFCNCSSRSPTHHFQALAILREPWLCDAVPSLVLHSVTIQVRHSCHYCVTCVSDSALTSSSFSSSSPSQVIMTTWHECAPQVASGAPAGPRAMRAAVRSQIPTSELNDDHSKGLARVRR